MYTGCNVTAGADELVSVDDLEECLETFHRNGWTDGLPIVPPTVDRVTRFLEAAAIAPDAVVATLPERSRTVTAGKVATNAVMAGCLPAHMPVVLAIFRCLARTEYNLNSAAISTSGGAPLVIVNGPVVRELGMRTGANVLGPGNRANAAIGRSVRLMLINLAGAIEGFDQSCIGHPGKYCYVLPEDEDGGWEPLHVQRGYDPGESVVTVLHTEAPQHVSEPAARTPERLLDNFADHVRSWNQGGCGVVVMNPEHRRVVQAAGWTKADVADYLFEHAGRTLGDLRRAGLTPEGGPGGDDDVEVRRPRDAGDFLVVGAGGPGQFSAVIPPWAGGVRTQPVSQAVRLGAQVP